ncbi:AIPR protein [Rhizobiales bacterium GAS191]|nr:AIPR protein [Rhizobiales bacterium GAS191]
MTTHVTSGYNLRRFYLLSLGKTADMDKVTEGFLSEFSSQFGVQSLPEKDRFEQFAAWLTVRRHFSDSTFVPADLATGSGGDTGIDAIAIIANNNLVTDVDTVEDLLSLNGYLDVTFVFVQAARTAHFETSKIGQLGFGVKDFFGEGKLPRNQAVKDFAEIMNALYEKSGKFRPRNPSCYLYYVTTGTWNADKDLVVRADAETGDLMKTALFSEVQFHPIGASEIHRLYRQAKNSISRDFVFDKKVVVPEVSGVTSAYLGYLPASDYLKLVCDEDGSIIKPLFYENVRDFVGLNDVNGEIVDTLESPDSDRFIIMNNGVTMIARGLHTTGDKFSISDFHIVNGCQTSHVLHTCKDKLPANVRVPFRLIHTQDENVIESIIRATNRQTEVKEDQFYAMKDFAKKLEAYFKTYPVAERIFYERRPHQYDNQDIEKLRIVTHQNLVRAVGAMFLGLPHITTKTFRQLIAKVGKDMFVDTDKPESYYVSAWALYRLEQLFKNKKIDAKYKAARFQILLAARFLLDGAPLPKMNANDMTKRCDAMIAKLKDDDEVEKLFFNAVKIVDEVAGNWDRDSIRTEPVSKSLFQKFGQHYSG